MTDICSGSFYKFEDNKISLILFADAVTYVKSVSKQMWAIFSCVAELPPSLRFSYENIIFHSIWSGPDLDFNLFLKKYNKNIDDLLVSGIFFNKIKVKTEILAFIADSPARSKLLNSMQFNGAFGCLFCLHPVDRNSKNTGQIYPIHYNIKLRTRKEYEANVTESIRSGKTILGIKGPSQIYNWNKNIPESVLIDYMHLCLIGTFKSMMKNFFDVSNKNMDYYIGIFKLKRYFHKIYNNPFMYF